MNANDCPIPAELRKLIESGVWPSVESNHVYQEREPIIGREAAQKVSPDDVKIVLMRSPFHTIADEVARGNELFWTEFLSNVGEIDYSKALIIADFGLGSDSCIILYYDDSEPCVMYLKWSFDDKSTPKHSWVRTHNSFADFADAVGLL